MNILLTSVGRRAYMVKYFKDALGREGKVYVSNSEPTSVAFKYADGSTISPLIYDERYIPFLLEYCQEKNIKILIPLFDIDLLVLAQNKTNFENIGTQVIVSPTNIIEICNDKWKTYQFLLKCRICTPKTYLRKEEVLNKIATKEMCYPIIIKPRFGCGSISVSIAYDEEDLNYLTKKTIRNIADSYLKYESAVTKDQVIYQECLRGEEYGADVINDLNGQLRNVIVRKKIAMRAGETDIACIVNEPEVTNMLKRLGKLTKHIANMDCDIFVVNGKPYVLELNARFGGGYPFSHMGGCNLPKAIVNWVRGEFVDDQMLSAKTGLTGYKEITVTVM